MITRTMHFVWIDPTGEGRPFGADTFLNIESWRRGEPTHTKMLWLPSQVRTICEAAGRPDVAEAIRVCRFPSMQADIARLLLVYVFGGYWVDLKLHLRVPFLDSLAGYDLVLAEHFKKDDLPDPTGFICNSFFGAAPRHPIIGRALDLVCHNVARRMVGSIFHVTGATNLQNAVKEAGTIPNYRLIRYTEAWDGFFEIRGGQYNGPNMHWSQRQERRENPYRD